MVAVGIVLCIYRHNESIDADDRSEPEGLSRWTMNDLLSPPMAFAVILLAAVRPVAGVLSRLRASTAQAPRPGMTKPYACGEDVPDHMIQPDYGQFFPFAFFFTILHVVALMVTTVPAATPAAASAIAVRLPARRGGRACRSCIRR